MKNIFFTTLICTLISMLSMNIGVAEDNHDHDHAETHTEHNEAKKSNDHDEHDEHAEHEEHQENDDHEGHDDHESSKAVGPGKAIEAVDEKLGFKLSKAANANLEIVLQSFSGTLMKLPKKALVQVKDQIYLYRYRDEYYKLISAKLVNEKSDSVTVKIDSHQYGDQIVVSGTSLLRVSDVYANDEASYAHSH